MNKFLRLQLENIILLIFTRDVHKYAKNVNWNGKSTRNNGNGNFTICAQISIGRFDANAIQ